MIGAEREHPRGVGRRHDRAERHGLAGRAAGPDQVGGHHRLAVPGGERVHGAPAEGGEQQQEQHALAGRRVPEDLGEPLVGAPHRRAGGGARAVGRAQRPGALRHAEAGDTQVRRALEQVGRVAAQPVRRIPGRRARAHRRPAARPADDRLPPDPPGERAVAQLDALRVAHRRRERQLDPGGAQPALALGVGDRRAAGGLQGDAAPVDREHEAPGHLGALLRQQPRIGDAALLERRDLGLVEHVADVDAVRGHAQPGEVVDGEVAQRMRGGDGRHRHERHDGGGEEGEQPGHRRASFACRACQGNAASP